MDKFADRLEKLSELSKEEIDTLLQDIRAEFKTVSDGEKNAETVEAMEALVSQHKAVKEALTAVEKKESELAARAEEAFASMSDKDDSAPGPDASDDEPESADEDATEVNKKLAEDEESGEADVLSAVDEDEDEDEKLNEANAASVPVHTSDTDTTEEEKKRLIEQEIEKAGEEKDPQDFKAAKQASDPEDPDKVAEDAKKANKAATATETPVEAEAATSKEIPEDEQEKILEEEADKAKKNKASETENKNREDETVTASANKIQAPEDRKPSAPAVAPRTILAGSDLPGITAGSPLPDLKSVANALLQRKNGMGRTSGGDGEKHTVASFQTEFPEERKLSMTDIEGNRARMQASSTEAVTAAGGLLGPVDTKYDLYGIGEASRPVRDSLPVFNAERGGIRFITPPVMSDLAGAVATWTLADDIAAASSDGSTKVKPCLRVKGGEEVTVYLDAITLCLTFGNLGARAFPELVERHTELGMLWHARFAETRLLTRIGALSTNVTAPSQLGAARDVFVQVEQAAAAYRSRHRMGPADKLRAIFPEWFKNALRADLTKQAPGDGRETTFELAETQINNWFAVRGINVTWSVEGETGQVFGPQAKDNRAAGTDGKLNTEDDVITPATLTPFPSTVIWYLFSEGTFVFLDGGTLDLGLVRDSTLNGTNDYQIFLETFEGVAKVGVESLRVESQLKIVGSASDLTQINS